MLLPEELSQDAGSEHRARGDDVPSRAHQKIREVRSARQAAHHAIGERRPPDAHADESLQQPLSEELTSPGQAVRSQGRGRNGFIAPARQRGDEAGSGELCAAHRAVDPLARKRVEEIRRVADQKGSPARRDGRARPLRERTRGQHVANQAPVVEPPRKPGKFLELGEKAAAEVPALLSYRRERQHQRHRGDAAADRPEAHIAAPADVQLTHAVHSRDVGHMRRERDPPRRRRANQPEPARHHRAQPIGAHDNACVTRYTLPATVRESFSVVRARGDTRDRSALPQQVLHRGGLAYLGPRPSRGGHEDRVEGGPWQGETGGAGTAEPAAHGDPAGRDHLHAVQLGMRRTLYFGDDIPIEPLQDLRSGRAQILGARLVAGEPGAVEEQHRRAGAGEQQRGRRAGRTGSDDDGIPALSHDGVASRAAAAPTSVAAKFTPSLSSHRQPVASRTGSWHTVLPRSNRASHAGHSYLPCSVAPKTESASMPATPAATSVTNPGAMPRGERPCVSPAMTAAPATPPSVSNAVMTPDVPRVTLFPEVMRRGANGEYAPISVAHVSAAAAAMAPAAPAHEPSNAASRATPPLASTWCALRLGPRRSA